jgi:predicted nucleotidyltransferase
MSTPSPLDQLPQALQRVVERFVAACRADNRIEAAFLGGSYAAGTADAHSDLDLGVIIADADYDAFLADKATFVGHLGEPLFLESFERPQNAFFVLADGTEGELAIGRASDFTRIHSGPYRVLLDKRGLLAGAVFHGDTLSPDEQLERLRQLVYWFWHDLSHFIVALGRGQLWWAQGQLEDLRRYAVHLARLRHAFDGSDDGYWKLEQAVPIAELEPLRATWPTLERDALLAAALAVVGYYQALAPELAAAHAIPYPQDLERILLARLERLRQYVPA